jgi:hypothetical protein
MLGCSGLVMPLSHGSLSSGFAEETENSSGSTEPEVRENTKKTENNVGSAEPEVRESTKKVESAASDSSSGSAEETENSVGSVEAWKDLEEMDDDMHSYRKGKVGFPPEYFKKIEQRIKATARVKAKDKKQFNQEECDQIEHALCLFYLGKDWLRSTRSVRKLWNKDKDDKVIVESLNGLIELIDNQYNEHMEMAKAFYGENAKNDKDFTKLALYRAHLHTNLKKRNLYYNFEDAVASMIDLYEQTKISEIKKIIEKELKKIHYEYNKEDDSVFGSRSLGYYGQIRIKEFSGKRILTNKLNKR